TCRSPLRPPPLSQFRYELVVLSSTPYQLTEASDRTRFRLSLARLARPGCSSPGEIRCHFPCTHMEAVPLHPSGSQRIHRPAPPTQPAHGRRQARWQCELIPTFAPRLTTLLARPR